MKDDDNNKDGMYLFLKEEEEEEGGGCDIILCPSNYDTLTYILLHIILFINIKIYIFVVQNTVRVDRRTNTVYACTTHATGTC